MNLYSGKVAKNGEKKKKQGSKLNKGRSYTEKLSKQTNSPARQEQKKTKGLS